MQHARLCLKFPRAGRKHPHPPSLRVGKMILKRSQREPIERKSEQACMAQPRRPKLSGCDILELSIVIRLSDGPHISYLFLLVNSYSLAFCPGISVMQFPLVRYDASFIAVPRMAQWPARIRSFR